MRKWISVVALVLILAGVNWSIASKEKHIASGRTAYLKLMPVDPRSLMQGDYMALRFELAGKIAEQLPKDKENKIRRLRHKIAAGDGFVVAVLDKDNVALFKTLYQDDMQLAENEIKMQYRVRNGKVKFATNAYFFQEGTAKVYEKAKYGQFRVNDIGEILLVDMYDEKLMLLNADTDEKEPAR